jgi:hypothetical protein
LPIFARRLPAGIFIEAVEAAGISGPSEKWRKAAK